MKAPSTALGFTILHLAIGFTGDFQPDGRVEILADQGKTIAFTGKWYAGGPNLYLRFHPESAERALIVWRIVDVSADEFRVQAWRDGEIVTYKRLKLPNASNQAMQRTAGRLAF
ncbi:MAG: hypothetical protein ACR2HH_14570 [Chthoniobacterales bacterium]